MKVKIIKLHASILLLFIIACTPSNPKIEIPVQHDTNKVSPKFERDTIGNCVLCMDADTAAACCRCEISKDVIRYQSMAGRCSECFQYNDRSISISRYMYKEYFQVNFVVEINELNIAVKINLIPKGVMLDRPYESNKNAFHYINRGVIIANRARFLAELEKSKIFDLKPLGGYCTGIGCVHVYIKKDEEIRCYVHILSQDTAYQNAINHVQRLIEIELADAGITF
jgi:hypothetical protein